MSYEHKQRDLLSSKLFITHKFIFSCRPSCIQIVNIKLSIVKITFISASNFDRRRSGITTRTYSLLHFFSWLVNYTLSLFYFFFVAVFVVESDYGQRRRCYDSCKCPLVLPSFPPQQKRSVGGVATAYVS